MPINSENDDSKSRAEDVRYFGRLRGRYALPRLKQLGKQAAFECMTQSVSQNLVVLQGPESGRRGDVVVANIKELGLLHGTISRSFKGGLALDIDAKAVDIGQLIERIRVLKQSEGTLMKKLMVNNARSVVLLPSGEAMDCVVVDISQSGASVSTAMPPKKGTAITLGQVPGKVVRLHDNGFAMKFDKEQDLEELEARIKPQGPNRVDVTWL